MAMLVAAMKTGTRWMIVTHGQSMVQTEVIGDRRQRGHANDLSRLAMICGCLGLSGVGKGGHVRSRGLSLALAVLHTFSSLSEVKTEVV